jgi:hypothetical protein
MIYGIERIQINCNSDFLHERLLKSAQYYEQLDSIYREILPLHDGSIITDVTKDDIKGRYDAVEGIDIILTLLDGSRLTLQEKLLFKGFYTVTFETKKHSGKLGAWYYCTSQLYFCAEIQDDIIVAYVLLDLLRVKLLSNGARINWRYNRGSHRSNEEFKYVNFKDIPEECIIARKI